MVHTLHRSWVRLTYAYRVCPLPNKYPARHLPCSCPVAHVRLRAVFALVNRHRKNELTVNGFKLCLDFVTKGR